MRFVMILAHFECLGIIIEERDPAGHRACLLRGFLEQAAVDQAFCDLHGI